MFKPSDLPGLFNVQFLIKCHGLTSTASAVTVLKLDGHLVTTACAHERPAIQPAMQKKRGGGHSDGKKLSLPDKMEGRI